MITQAMYKGRVNSTTKCNALDDSKNLMRDLRVLAFLGPMIQLVQNHDNPWLVKALKERDLWCWRWVGPVLLARAIVMQPGIPGNVGRSLPS